MIAILVILAMLALMGIPPTVIIFFATVIYFVWRAVDRSEQHETRRIFDFYLAANEILREDERRWYGFEMSEVIAQGESVLHSMSDAPPLLYFTLGALYQRAGDHEAATEHLAYVLGHEAGEEQHRHAPSPELRRYVSVLRRREREPAEGPQTIAAIRHLERQRRTHAAAMLTESRRLNVAPVLETAARESYPAAIASITTDHSNHVPLAAGTQPPPVASSSPPSKPAPISEVLRDLYEEEKRTA